MKWYEEATLRALDPIVERTTDEVVARVRAEPEATGERAPEHVRQELRRLRADGRVVSRSASNGRAVEVWWRLA